MQLIFVQSLIDIVYFTSVNCPSVMVLLIFKHDDGHKTPRVGRDFRSRVNGAEIGRAVESKLDVLRGGTAREEQERGQQNCRQRRSHRDSRFAESLGAKPCLGATETCDEPASRTRRVLRSYSSAKRNSTPRLGEQGWLVRRAVGVLRHRGRFNDSLGRVIDGNDAITIDHAVVAHDVTAVPRWQAE